MKIIRVKTYDELSKTAAEMIAKQITEKPNCVLGFATGSSPVGTYKHLVEMCKDDKISFAGVTTFNLDEYCGLDKSNPQSYHHFMMQNLFNHVDINHSNIHLPNGVASDTNKECADYESKISNAGGIDLQLLGVGSNGHIGFNEPATVFQNLTHEVALAESTIEANKRFFDNINDVPKTAITMGIGTIMSAKKIILVAGPEKGHIIKKLETDFVADPQFPVSILHYHPDCTIIYVCQ